MISLKEYAKRNHITYEAVRAQVSRYREQLDDHIIQDGRTQYLDDIAVAFLDERRQKNPVVVYQQSKDETIEEMRKELEGAYKTIAAQAVMITDLQQFKIESMENRQLLEDVRTSQERRERELQAREGEFTRELDAAREKAAEAAQRAAEEKAAQDIDKAVQEAKYEADKRLEGVCDEHRKETAILLQEIQSLKDRTFWDYLMAWFRKKEK